MKRGMERGMERGVLAIAAVSVGVACGSSKEEPTKTEDPRLVVIDEKGISIGGTRIGDVPGDVVAKVDVLYNSLKTQRETWKAQNPATPFDGSLRMELGPELKCRAAMSALQTAAFAGYPELTVQQGALSLKVRGAVPKPPSPDLSKPAPERMTIAFLPDGKVEVRPQRCGAAFDVVPPEQVPAAIKEACGDAAECFDALAVACEVGIPFSKVLPSILEIQKDWSKLELSTGSLTCQPGEGPHTARMDFPPSPAEPPPAPPPQRRPVDGTVKLDKLTAKGGVTDAEAKQALSVVLPELKACYERGLLFNPNLQGIVTTRLFIGKPGGVVRASMGGGDLPDNQVARCVVAKTGAAQFPSKNAATHTEVSFIFVPK